MKFILTQGARTIQDRYTKPVAPKYYVGIYSEGDEVREEYNCEMVTFQSKIAPILFEINVLDSTQRTTLYITSSDTRMRGPRTYVNLYINTGTPQVNEPKMVTKRIEEPVLIAPRVRYVINEVVTYSLPPHLSN